MLRTARETQGLTQLELAKRAKVTNVYLSQLEQGKKKNPSLAVLRRIAKGSLLSGRYRARLTFCAGKIY